MSVDHQLPRIFYLCYDHARPTGGQKHSYRHVDVLRDLGFEAYAVHSDANAALKWFDNSTPVIGFEDFKTLHRRERDILVLPEDLGGKIRRFPGKKVIFNKNVYYGFRAVADTPIDQDPYRDPDVVAVMATSPHNQQHLQFAYPHATVLLVHCQIDPAVFAYGDARDRTRSIACSAKNRVHTAMLRHLVRARAAAGLNDASGVQWQRLEDLSEAEVASTFQRASAFVCLSTEEGIARTVLEAMMCGCIVCTYAHGPVAPYAPPECQFQLGDLVGAARFLEQLSARGDTSSPDPWEALRQCCRSRALAFVEHERRSIAEAWDVILRRAGAG